MKKRRTTCILLAALAALFISCSTSFASHAAVDSWSGSYGHQSRFDNCIIIDGIDVSEWQTGVDYHAVKQHGIDYVFIRVGKTATDIFNSVKDTEFEMHYTAAREASLMVGAYYYSTATTAAEAEAEAANVINWLGGRELHLPVVLDYEDSERVIASNANRTAIALKFMEYIESHSDYDAMFYSYRALMDINWAGSVFEMPQIDSRYPVWIAQYSQDINSYTSPFTFWQYTDSGNVAGISSAVDCNFWYFDPSGYPADSGKEAIQNATATLSQTLYTYDGTVKTPSVTLVHNGTTLQEGIDYQLSYIKNAKAGDAYALVKGLGSYDGYKVVPFGVKIPLNSINCTISDISSQICTSSALTPEVNVYYEGTPLQRDTDYTVSYKNTTKAGTATAVIEGAGPYSGRLQQDFTVKIGKPSGVKASLRASKTSGYDDVKVSWKKVFGASSYRVYYKKASASSYKNYKKVSGGSVTSKTISGLSTGTKYQFKVVAYAPNGTKGSFSSVKSATTLKKVAQKKVKKYSTSKVKLSWTNIEGETGYEISRSTKKDGTKVIATVKSTSAKSKTLKVPKKGTRYYYKVRAYKLVNGVRVCGPWSDVKSYKL